MIRTTTFYSVVCDDCGTATIDISEFPAWDDEVYVIEGWVCHGGYSGEFGDLCEKCHPRCLCGCINDDDEDFCDCVECPDHGGEPR